MKRILILLACLLSLASCYAPVDLSLSQAVTILRSGNVTYRATIGPMGDFGGDDGAGELAFLPSKSSVAPGIDFENGYVVMRSPTRTLMRYAAGKQVFGWWGADYVNPAPQYEPYLLEPMKFTLAGTASALGMVGMNPLDPTGNMVQIVSASLGGGFFDYPTGWKSLHNDFIFGMAPSYDADMIGFSVYPSDWGQSWDDTYWLIRERGTGQLREQTARLDAANGFWTKNDTKAPPLAFDIPELAGVTRCSYFFDADPVGARWPTVDEKRSYVSWYDTAAGGWKCVSWKQSALVVESALLPAVTHRIDALLTTGMLFSTEDGVGRLYDWDGVQQAEFPLGALRFVGERYVDGTPTSVFSIAHRISQDHQTEWYIDVYTVETAKLAQL
jgi:hypothetical protein